MDLAHAALPEIYVADGQGLVHQQNFGIHMDRHRECEPHDHAARICLDGTIDEVADLREGLDFGEASVHFLSGKAQDRAIEINVVAAGELGIETGARVPAAPTLVPFTATVPSVGSRMPAQICRSVLFAATVLALRCRMFRRD